MTWSLLTWCVMAAGCWGWSPDWSPVVSVLMLSVSVVGWGSAISLRASDRARSLESSESDCRLRRLDQDWVTLGQGDSGRRTPITGSGSDTADHGQSSDQSRGDTGGCTGCLCRAAETRSWWLMMADDQAGARGRLRPDTRQRTVRAVRQVSGERYIADIMTGVCYNCDRVHSLDQLRSPEPEPGGHQPPARLRQYQAAAATRPGSQSVHALVNLFPKWSFLYFNKHRSALNYKGMTNCHDCHDDLTLCVMTIALVMSWRPHWPLCTMAGLTAVTSCQAGPGLWLHPHCMMTAAELSLHWSDSWQLAGSNSWPLSASLCPAPDRLLSLSPLSESPRGTWSARSSPPPPYLGQEAPPLIAASCHTFDFSPSYSYNQRGATLTMLSSCINNSCPLVVIHHNPSGWALTPAHSHCLDHAETGHRHDVTTSGIFVVCWDWGIEDTDSITPVHTAPGTNFYSAQTRQTTNSLYHQAKNWASGRYNESLITL